jgi:hypothetical protein
MRNSEVTTVYIQHEDEEHRVILNDIHFSSTDLILDK